MNKDQIESWDYNDGTWQSIGDISMPGRDEIAPYFPATENIGD